jgi:Na+-transporting methylmalonyl-CoA/oxaloacetate decarboxylase gamma subunit
MKLDNQVLLQKVAKAQVFLQKYAAFMFVIIFLCIYVFLVQRIGQLINSEASPQAVTETSTKPISRLKVDKAAAEQMLQLESQNIEVRTLFNQARQNPFTE